ncbi:MAG: helix-turn-helix domain-containing protein [Anaerolineae bacterium]|nr:TetR/AcrR family transcriptional regulator [Anaerolineae bacterium]MDW8300082.1 helix-turn-helix domain-containing protein [Anaerolineae bacterium]
MFKRLPDPRDPVLAAARELFVQNGYTETSLEQVARRANLDPAAVQRQYSDKDKLLAAVLRAYSPQAELEAALDAVQGETAADILRDMMHRLVTVAQRHEDFFELALVDAQSNNGTFLSNLSAAILPKATEILKRMKAKDELRPASDAVIGRTLVAMWIGYIVSERALPQAARFAMRLLPQTVWLDGMIDLMLYGLLEDDARG